MIICPVCGSSCDPGEIRSGKCLDCIEEEQKMQARGEHAIMVMPQPLCQFDFEEVLHGKAGV